MLDRARGWREVEVPGLWTMQGFGRPHYTNVVMPFRDPPPNVPEQNETGIYRRAFTIPRGWRSRPVVLHFGGAEGALLRAGERRAGRDRQGLPHTGGVRHQQARPPRRPERARSPSSSAGRTRASSRIRTSGGTPGCRARSDSSRRPCATSRFAPAATGGSRCSPSRARPRLLDARGRAVAKGELRNGRLDGDVRAPRLWSAEEPALYTLELGADGETVTASLGFRDVEIRDRQLLVNGEPVLIAGVNRHDHDDTPRPRRHPGADGARRAADEAVQRQRRAHARTTRTTPTGSSSATGSACTSSTRRTSSRTRYYDELCRRPALSHASGSSASRTWSSATRTTRA